MEHLNNNINLRAESSEPLGLRFLATHPKREKETLEQLSQCCQEHPFGCGFESECHKRYEIVSERWPRLERIDYAPKAQTIEEKYATWLGQLTRQTLRQRVRERPIY
jgi:hypothetical protein